MSETNNGLPAATVEAASHAARQLEAEGDDDDAVAEADPSKRYCRCVLPSLRACSHTHHFAACPSIYLQAHLQARQTHASQQSH